VFVLSLTVLRVKGGRCQPIVHAAGRQVITEDRVEDSGTFAEWKVARVSPQNVERDPLPVRPLVFAFARRGLSGGGRVACHCELI
jgi:hypothetical protein